MAQSPSHKLGQIIGELLEAAVYPLFILLLFKNSPLFLCPNLKSQIKPV